MQAHTNLELACVTPFPDVNFYTAIQRDFTDPNVRRHTFNMQVGLPVPIWDRNQGNIQSAQATVVRTSHESTRLRNDLVTKLADAFQRFDSADIVVTTYRDQVIPDLSRVYRSVYERHQQEPDVVGFGDIIVAQQTLLQAITQYAVALGDRWTAFVEILSLMQVEDLQQLPSTSSGVETPAP
jgi:cobalt-zinc-cadmium efflux system outer membrane protein